MASQYITYEQRNGVGYIIMDKPKANAYNLAFHEQLLDAIHLANEDNKINAVILSSASEKFFCAGADIKEFAENDTATNKKMVIAARQSVAAMEASNKIFIAAISGHCLGGGLEIALACDIRVASNKHFSMGLTETKLGLIAGNGGTQRLARLIGATRAIELIVTGTVFGADKAHEYGIVNQLYTAEEFEQKTLAIAQTICNGAGLAIAATKRAIRMGIEVPLLAGLELEAGEADRLYDTYDAKEGFQAFVEKRDPVYLNR